MLTVSPTLSVVPLEAIGVALITVTVEAAARTGEANPPSKVKIAINDATKPFCHGRRVSIISSPYLNIFNTLIKSKNYS
jgi:hypothetical protein